jgi:N-acetylglucosamine kinase-like BadF-type ATPase
MSLIGVGIDSGGTHTTFAVKYSDDAQKTAMMESSSTLADSRSAMSMRRAAEWIVSRILDLTQPGDECCVWIGAAAGIMSTSTSALEQTFEVPLLQLSGRNIDCEIFIANDAVSILKSPPLHGQGIVAIIGTGSMVVGAHPACPDGIIRRSGYEWPVGDQGAGVWMTFEPIRMVLEDIRMRGRDAYHSPLLDRLCDYFNVDSAPFSSIPDSYSSLARVEELASTLARAGEDSKRRIAGFVHPTDDPGAVRLAATALNFRDVCPFAGGLTARS